MLLPGWRIWGPRAFPSTAQGRVRLSFLVPLRQLGVKPVGRGWAMGEEWGLRGFALPRRQERYSPLSAALIIGVLWALWHLPVLIALYAGLHALGLDRPVRWSADGYPEPGPLQ